MKPTMVANQFSNAFSQKDRRSWRYVIGDCKDLSIPIRRAPAFAMMLLLLTTLAACKHETASHDVYTCPMHPTVLSDKPGACPVCHMDLVKKVPGAEVTIDGELAAATESPDKQVMSSIRTVKGSFTALPQTLTRTGIVTYDARNRSTVSARVAGRLEKVLVRYAYQHVRKGEKIAEIYSPDLAAAQRDFLSLQRTDAGNAALLNASRQRLRNMGMTDAQIEQVSARNEVVYSVPLFSPAEGIVVQRGGQTPTAPAETAAPPSGGMGGGSMETSANAPAPSASKGTAGTDLLREGTYVTVGQPLFEVVNVSRLLLEFNLPASAATSVHQGDALMVSTRGHQFKTTIGLIQPFTNAGEPFIKIRAYVSDSKELVVGQLITATITLPPTDGLWLPLSAVYDLGTRRVAFVKHGQHFTAVEVETGAIAGDQIMVISGVASSDEVAAAAQFLIDNEGFIKTL